MIKIGIECESIEDQNWGIGRILNKLLEEISQRPELKKEFRFFLYFKSKIPDLAFLNNEIFIKKIVKPAFIPASFSLYYYLFLPIKLWFERLDMMFFPNYMLPIIFRGKSLVILTEDIYHEMQRSDLPWRYKLAYKIFAGWWAAGHATKIIAISETSKQELIKLFGIPPHRIVVNQLGVSGSKKNLDLQNNKQGDYILYVGQAFPRRHLRETMLAFEMIAPDFPDLKLIAIGYDRYNPPVVKKLAEEINRRLGQEGIIYKEYVPEKELAQLYTGAKLLIYISSKEAFGLPPLEALGYNVPAVVADQPVTREIFGNPPAGRAFFVVNPDDPKSITATIAEGLTNETKCQEIKNASNSILAKYTWQKHTDRFLQIVASP